MEERKSGTVGFRQLVNSEDGGREKKDEKIVLKGTDRGQKGNEGCRQGRTIYLSKISRFNL